MKALGLIGTGVLLVFLGTVATTNARQEKREGEAGPAKQEQQAKPEQQKPQARPQAQPQTRPNQAQQAPAKQAKQEQQAQPRKQPAQAQAKSSESRQQPVKQAKQEQRAKPARQQSQVKQVKQQPQAKPVQQGKVQRTAAAQQRQHAEPALRLSARGSSRIPDARFRASFGRGHEFHMSPSLVGGYSRFQYGGYWFGFVDPWPADWYYTDDVYVDYVDGGYFLFNPYYPGSRIAISVVL